MRRVLPVAVAAAALCFSQLTAPATAQVSVTGFSSGIAAKAPGSQKAAKAQKKFRSKYALAAAAYGSRVEGGSVPANSQDTAYQRIGCTNVVGRDNSNVVADQTIPGLGKIVGVRTHVWTEKVGNKVSSFAEHKIARVIIGSSSVGSLEIIGLSSLSEAFNNNGTFGTKVTNSVAKIQLKAAGQPLQSFDIPAPGQTLTIPGLASLSIGKSNRRAGKDFARVSANVLDIKVIPLGTRVRVAQTNAAIQGGIKQGVFKGYSAGVEARGLADNLKVGRTPLALIPCRGTKGEEIGKDIAGVGLGQLGNLKGVAAGAKASNSAKVAQGTVAGRVAEVSLLGDRIHINGILGVATVKRERGVLSRSSKGSTVLEIIVDGTSYKIPAIGKLEIPGLLKLEDAVEVKTKNGLKVIGLRITLLDGTGAVLDLGVAEIGIRPGNRFAAPK